ncbi:substrate-binding periplasmic protein [Hyphomonas johnsonii]|uniref:Uncharacterized protein n=1 Tax=Hyphomonas johnsonii MHS-2 TaxID=1280950 RepID=A0A059FUZ9_9PROT|nr:transporter substrate-binding domain-containing protein [Hyphomonas johnsonii]KCZ94427.1 hypothetical protein HJO_03595 [Hyphomonas johnsonii MHS-2]
MEVIVTIIVALISLIVGWPQIRKQWKEYRNDKKKKQKGRQSKLETVLGANRLKVGVIPFPPLADYDRLGKGAWTYSGLYKAVFDDIGNRLGLDVEYCPARNDKAFDLLNGDKVDVIACLIRNSQRVRKADFALLRHTLSLNGLCRSGDERLLTMSGIRDHDVRIVTVSGEIGSTAILDFGIDESQLTVMQTDEVSDIFHLVENNAADVAITDGITCKQYLDDNTTQTNLEFAFRGTPLLVDACGLMTKQAQPRFSEWLKREVEISFSNKDLAAMENALLEQFPGVLNRM